MKLKLDIESYLFLNYYFFPITVTVLYSFLLRRAIRLSLIFSVKKNGLTNYGCWTVAAFRLDFHYRQRALLFSFVLSQH